MNGTHHVDIVSQLGTGSGTVYLDGHTFRGGNHTMAYFGPCKIDNNVLQAEMDLLNIAMVSASLEMLQKQSLKVPLGIPFNEKEIL